MQLPLDNLESILQHQFARRALLEQALTHSSYAEENAPVSEAASGDNEQLEFLGDAVLQLSVSRELFQRFPDSTEGELSKLRAHLVNAAYLAQCASGINLGEHLRLGRGESKNGGRRKTNLLSDALEAVVAALYLDGGFAVAHAFILARIVTPELERLSNAEGGVSLEADHRSRLQSLLHSTGRPEPRYELVGEDGPPHRRSFTMRVTVLTSENEAEFATEGRGNSKKEASRLAAQKALERMTGISHG